MEPPPSQKPVLHNAGCIMVGLFPGWIRKNARAFFAIPVTIPIAIPVTVPGAFPARAAVCPGGPDFAVRAAGVRWRKNSPQKMGQKTGM